MKGRCLNPLTNGPYFQLGHSHISQGGDIVGFLIAKGGLTSDEIGVITLRDHSALVGIPRAKGKSLVDTLGRERIKNTRAKISLL